MNAAEAASAQPLAEAGPRYARSEATRLLCAGAYFDGVFRRRVIEELVEHEERPIAPSLGLDALPVLAHALRARRQETEAGLLLTAVWALFIGLGLGGVGSDRGLLPVPWFLAYGVVCAVSWMLRGDRGSAFPLDRRVLKEATRGRLKAVLPVVPIGLALVYWGAAVVALVNGANVWATFVCPLLLVPPVWAYRRRVVDVIRRELSRETFGEQPRKTLPEGEPYDRIGAAIDREQHAHLTIYDPFRPFIGAGTPYKPWSVVMELKRAKTPDVAPLTGREVIDLIKPSLERLRTSAATSRDRLRSLEVDELVYLPVGLARNLLTHELDETERHVAAAVGEGGEGRRHFLRVRIGAWDEEVGISVLVRVHTQGGMLVLEVVPHVLKPLRPEFRSVDVIGRPETDGHSLLRDAVSALVAGPGAGVSAGVCMIGTAVSALRTWLTMPQYALPDGPAASVRELGSVEEISLFQEMDVSRYVRTLQDRIASGVRTALHEKGYETGEFERSVVHVGEGGMYIGQMSGSVVAVGENSSAMHLETTADPKGGAV